MSLPRFHDTAHQACLSATLKAVRRARAMKAKDVAMAMGLPPRSYERFEAGGGHFDFEKVRHFATVTSSDPFAILAAVLTGSPGLAVESADNKLSALMILALEEFYRDAGDTIRLLDSAAILTAFSRTFRDLGRLAATRADLATGKRILEDHDDDPPLPDTDPDPG